LPEKTQLKVLADLTERRGRELRRRYSNILAVGLGQKAVAGKVLPQLCLGFLVREKSRGAPAQVPASVTTTVRYRGRLRRVSVPTDVEEAGQGEPQLATNAADGVLIASPSNAALRAKGAVCCLVRVQGRSGLYVLSCHHVLTLSGTLGQCRVQRDALVADGSGVPYAQLFDWVPMTPGAPSQLDAAISLVQAGNNVVWGHSGMQATAVDFGETKPENCSIFAPQGRVIPARFRKVWRELELPYPGCLVKIATAYQFDAQTFGGDSGSPVMDANGRLYGMHFWGDPQRSFALSIPAGLLFGPRVFAAGRLQLA
jgi:hypothetical protein